MVVVPGYERDARPLGEPRERIDRSRIGARSGAHERSDWPAWPRLDVDVKPGKETLQPALGRAHPGELENVSKKDQLTVFTCDSFAQ